jgi:hypothetical protein
MDVDREHSAGQTHHQQYRERPSHTGGSPQGEEQLRCRIDRGEHLRFTYDYRRDASPVPGYSLAPFTAQVRRYSFSKTVTNHGIRSYYNPRMTGDLAKLQGTWTVTSLETDGTKVPLPDQGSVELHRVRNLEALDLVFTDGHVAPGYFCGALLTDFR